MSLRRVLIVTNMWPGEGRAHVGLFVRQQVEALRRVAPACRFDVVTVAGPRGRRDYFAALPRLRRRIRESYDVVHAHYGLTGAMAALARGSTPLVVTLHGSDVDIGWQRVVSRFAARRATAVITVSERLTERLGRAASVIPCGVPIDRFRPGDRAGARARLRLPTDRPVVLFPADPTNRVKGYPLFAAALAATRADGFDPVELTLVDIEPGDVPERMVAADVVVITSRHEGSPMVVKEALACGVPVVAVDVGDVGTMLARLPGCRVVARDPVALAGAIGAAVTQRPAAEGARRQRVLDLGLDGETVARRVLGVLETAAAGPGAGEPAS